MTTAPRDAPDRHLDRVPGPGPSTLAAVSSAVRPSSLGTRLAAAVLLGVLVLVAVSALPAVRAAGVCVGEDCEDDAVTVAAAAADASAPNPVRPAPPCVHDASCAGAHGGASAGLLFAAVAAGVAVALAAAAGRARLPGDARFLAQLAGGQLYRPPRFA